MFAASEPGQRIVVVSVAKYVAAVLDLFRIPRPKGKFQVEILRTKNGFVKGFILRQPGTTGRANTFRYMNWRADARYPNGYVRYFNKDNQPIDPATGKPGPDKSVLTHRTPSYQGDWRGLPDWWYKP